MSSVWDAVEDADRVAVVEETDDSCAAHPTHALTDSHCSPDFTGPVIEVKWENFPDVKIEFADENDVECKDFSVKVRDYAIGILMFLKHAVHVRVLTHPIVTARAMLSTVLGVTILSVGRSVRPSVRHTRTL